MDAIAFTGYHLGFTAPEHFQKRMSDILAGQPGVLCVIDDTLIYGRTQEEHDAHLQSAYRDYKMLV